MKNLGTHEFGHILGLDDWVEIKDPIPNGYTRLYAMDPNFSKGDSYTKPTDKEWSAMKKHYTVPKPATIYLFSIAFIALTVFKIIRIVCFKRCEVNSNHIVA